MAELKTKETDNSVEKFINSIKDKQMKEDCYTVLELMQKITKSKPRMWGTSIVGFGNYHYVYESGREGDWFITGFSPRKQYLSLYFMSGFAEQNPLLEKLGKFKTGKGCLYLKSLKDADLTVLEKLIEQSVKKAK